MKILTEKRCVIGEGPIWNDKEKLLYFTNGMENEICTYRPEAEKLTVIPVKVGCAAFAFDIENRIIVSRADGVFIFNSDGTTTDIYDTSKYEIKYANDMKAGPDGCIYVGTQSSKRIGASDKIDGKLYRINKDGSVKLLLDGLLLSNGMEWSQNNRFFYHTDSDTGIIKEYFFGEELSFTGRQIKIPGVDGFTSDINDNLCITRWGYGEIVFFNTVLWQITERISLPCHAPASCGFCGNNMDILAVTTAALNADITIDKSAGYTLLLKRSIPGRKPFIYGENILSE